MLEVHPLAASYPDTQADDYERLVQSMKSYGFNPATPVITYEGKVLDGRTRQKAAFEAGVEPIYREWNGECGSPVDFVFVCNDPRRQGLDKSQRALAIGRLIAHAKASGLKTMLSIASEQNISRQTLFHGQVVASSCDDKVQAAVMEGKIAVSDAAKVADMPKQAQVHALGLVTKGKVKTLRQAKEHMTAKVGDASEDGFVPPEPEYDDDFDVDAAGNAIPERLADIFKSKVLEDCVANLTSIRNNLRSTANWHLWMQTGRLIEMLAEVSDQLQKNYVHAIHEACNGEGCDRCRGLGWLTKWRFEEDRA